MPTDSEPARTNELRVILVVNRFPARTETFVANQARRLGADVIATEPDGETVQSGPSVQVHYLGSGKPPLATVTARLRRRLLRSYVSPWSSRTRAALTSKLATLAPDVVLAHFGPTAIDTAPSCTALGLPLVAHFNGYDLSSLLRSSGYQTCLAKALPAVAAAVVVSADQARALVDLGFAPKRTHLIPCGVDTAAFRPARIDHGDGSFRFIGVGRLVSKKAPLATIRAFKHCHDNVPNSRLTLVGDGPLQQEVSRLVEELDLTDVVDLVGAQSHEQVMSHISRSDAFVQHSITDGQGNTEGWPVAIAEACSTSLPVVATRHAGIPTQVQHGMTGFLVEEHDWLDMGHRMAELAKSPARARAMGSNARQHIQSTGELDHQIAKLSRVLAEAVSGHSPRPRPHGKETWMPAGRAAE